MEDNQEDNEDNPFLDELESNINNSFYPQNDNNNKETLGNEYINFSVNPKFVRETLKIINEKYDEIKSILENIIGRHCSISAFYAKNHMYKDKDENNKKIINEVKALKNKIEEIHSSVNNLNKIDHNI